MKLEPGLVEVLGRSKDFGFLGPGDINDHIEHAKAFAAFVGDPQGSVLDLGSGGGIPGLVLATIWDKSRFWLLEGSQKRSDFLIEALESLDLSDRVCVIAQRAEEAGNGHLRETFDLVVSRSFGPPGVVAECGSPLLAIGGSLVVAEPPGGDLRRWPKDPLADLGLVLVDSQVSPAAFVRIQKVSSCPARFPRRTGVPNKRPLF